MTFTVRTVTHAFLNGDGTPASGSVQFTLTRRMTNGTQTIAAGGGPNVQLGPTGQLTTTLFANDDAGTYPTDAEWTVNLRLLGDRPEEFVIVVPSAGAPGPIDLGSLLPTTTSPD